MNRKQIEAAGVGAELLYSTTGQASAHAWCYRAVVESVEPRKIAHDYSGHKRGVDVTLWDEDGHQQHAPDWRADATTGMRYRRVVVPSVKLLGDWAPLRAEQLAQRERLEKIRANEEAAVERAREAIVALHTAMGVELRERFGSANLHNYSSDVVEVPAALLRELVGGWSYAMHAPEVGADVGEVPPWRVTS